MCECVREHRLEPARQPAASERAKTGWAEFFFFSVYNSIAMAM